eukprot:m.96337 g.96337  ORF g.96337 m.96337 type:complete len:1381 (-) comp14788_c0_seq1:232-4374(-)
MKRVFDIPGRTHGIGAIQFKWQTSKGNYLASSGANRNVYIVDRKGNSVSEFSLPGKCTALDWDKNGDQLAVVCDGGAMIFMWNANTKEVSQVESGLKGTLTYLKWSKVSMQFVVGNNKGDISIYNVQTARKLPILGKHRGPVLSCDWNMDDKFTVASTDQTISINNSAGDTLAQPLLEHEPTLVRCFDPAPGSEHKDITSQMSVVLDKKTLLLFKPDDPDHPIELAFQTRYGSIVDYQWFGDGKLLIGFSSGFFVIMSTRSSDVSQEEHQGRNHRTRLTSVACSEALGKIATCGDSQVKLMDMHEFSEVFAIIELEEDRGLLDAMAWTDDGQLLSISTENGALYTYLTKLPILGDVSDSSLAFLSSLQELTIAPDAGNPFKIKLPIEPSAVAVDEFYAACGMNNTAWFYLIEDGKAELIDSEPRTYTGSIKSIKLAGQYAAVHCGKKVQLHLVESHPDEDVPNTEKMFPSKSTEAIESVALTKTFLIYSTVDGAVYYFSLEDWQFVNEYKHPCGLAAMAVDSSGTRVAFIDEKGDGIVYSPVDDSTLTLPDFPTKAKGFVWDVSCEERTFIAYDEEIIYTYLDHFEHIDGSHCVLVGTTKLPYGLIPIRLDQGKVTCLTPSGKTTQLVLSTHTFLDAPVKDVELVEAVMANTLICKHREALALLDRLKRFAPQKAEPLFDKLAQSCLHCLEFDMAVHTYRLGGNAKMVQSLKSLEFVEDRFLLAGHVFLLLGNATKAEDLFLKSSRPEEALNMHRDLLQWEHALKLANRLSKKDIPSLSREYAQQLEFQGNWGKALELYTTALNGDTADRNHVLVCKAGMARTAVRHGDISQGISLANELNQKSLYRECGQALEEINQLNEAAEMYERGGQHDKAAAIFIKSKNWVKVGQLLQHVTSPKLHALYAKSREADGSYKEAVAAYEAANDYLSVIRLNLEHLRNPDEAVRIVKETGSVEGAKMVADFFRKMGDFESAVQFLVLSQANEEAFKMAQEHNQMAVYARVLESNGGTPEDYRRVAKTFDNLHDPVEAGRFYSKAGDFEQAIDRLLSTTGSDNTNIELAIEAVGKANNESLTQKVVDYLLGSIDGVPKDANFLLKLYLSAGRYKEAARTAIIIAAEERTAGSYRTAHDILFDMYNELRSRNVSVPPELYNDLVILHSYILGKIHLRRNDHMKAAHMLMRVADNISKFPAHVVNILTSAVIECFRAGLKASSFKYAAILMKPEYRDKLDAKYKKKIETIVRKKDLAEVEEETCPCPYCGIALKDSVLQCYQCKNKLPMCVASGYFVPKSQLVICPYRYSAARKADLDALMLTEDNLPMAYDTPGNYTIPEDPTQFLTAFQASFDSSVMDTSTQGDEYIDVAGELSYDDEADEGDEDEGDV